MPQEIAIDAIVPQAADLGAAARSGEPKATEARTATPKPAPPVELVGDGWRPNSVVRPDPWWRVLRGHLRQSPLHGIEACVAVSMLLSTVLNSYVVYRLQKVAIDQQTKIAKAALDSGEISSLRGLFSSQLAQVNLRTTEGRAAYATCLEAAITLDKQHNRIAYLTLLPRYDEENLALSLARDPVLLSLALKYGPKPVPPAIAATLWYVSIEYVGPNGRRELERRKVALRDEFNSASRTSEYPLRVMRLKDPDGYVLTVGGLQSRDTADEIAGELKHRPTPLAVSLVRSDRVVRPGDRTDADGKDLGSGHGASPSRG